MGRTCSVLWCCSAFTDSMVKVVFSALLLLLVIAFCAGRATDGNKAEEVEALDGVKQESRNSLTALISRVARGAEDHGKAFRKKSGVLGVKRGKNKKASGRREKKSKAIKRRGNKKLNGKKSGKKTHRH